MADSNERDISGAISLPGRTGGIPGCHNFSTDVYKLSGTENG